MRAYSLYAYGAAIKSPERAIKQEGGSEKKKKRYVLQLTPGGTKEALKNSQFTTHSFSLFTLHFSLFT